MIQPFNFNHERYGHQSEQHMKSIIEGEPNVKVNANTKLCKACVYGKNHHSKFGTKHTKTGEIISTDICGPFDESLQKFRYFAIFKDDYTKFK